MPLMPSPTPLPVPPLATLPAEPCKVRLSAPEPVGAKALPITMTAFVPLMLPAVLLESIVAEPPAALSLGALGLGALSLAVLSLAVLKGHGLLRIAGLQFEPLFRMHSRAMSCLWQEKATKQPRFLPTGPNPLTTGS